jgi:hypothetical protein
VLGTVRSVDLVVKWDGNFYKAVVHLRLGVRLTHLTHTWDVLENSISIPGRSVEITTDSP